MTLLLANLLHLSFNMWEEADSPTKRNDRKARPNLRFDEKLWEELLPRMVDAGFNTLVLDLGDGIRYRSHPEIAVRGAWEPQRLVDEVARLRSLGLEFVPKLNFSAAHDTWLGPVYSRSVSTPLYYEVCRDLITEVIELTSPRFFHLGMDEEIYEEQQWNNFVAIRQNDLLWHDLHFFFGEVEKGGVRPWIWANTIWRNSPSAFIEKMPRHVMQSVWHYGTDFSGDSIAAAYGKLSAAGFDQVPTCSCCYHDESPTLLVEFCRNAVASQRLSGFLQTPWCPTTIEYRRQHLTAIDAFKRALQQSPQAVVS